MKVRIALIALASSCYALILPALGLAQEDRVVESDTHRFVEVAEGVWLASGNGSLHTMSNAMVLVGEFDTLVVDSHVTPAAARALLESIPKVTDKPVRYLVNSHYISTMPTAIRHSPRVSRSSGTSLPAPSSAASWAMCWKKIPFAASPTRCPLR